MNSNNNKMPLTRSLTQPQGTIEYVVSANDTMTSVAARFHTTPSELARINRRSGHFIFPGQVLYVPKSSSNHNSKQLSTLSTDSVDRCGGGLSETNSGVPPNTPNDLGSSPSRTSSNATTVSGNDDQQQQLPDSPFPGHAERIATTATTATGGGDQIDGQEPSNNNGPVFGDAKNMISSPLPLESSTVPTTTPSSRRVSAIDPADRECLERFLKINVRYITDGKGVVSGVLLVTPNALMFDSNVSDPLVIEHGPEMYNVTIPIDLVLKTALYSDIAHMRVKHAPEAVPSVPKPAVYYASDDDTTGIVEENLKNAIAKKKAVFEKVNEEEKPDEQPPAPVPASPPPPPPSQPPPPPDDSDEYCEFKDAIDCCNNETETIINNNNSCDDDNNNVDNNSDKKEQEIRKKSEQSSNSVHNNDDRSNNHQIRQSVSSSSTEEQSIQDDDEEEETTSSSAKYMIDIGSIDDDLNLSYSTPPQSANEHQQQQQVAARKKPSPANLAKVTLGERHSAPLAVLSETGQDSGSAGSDHKQLVSAVSAEETTTDSSSGWKRLSQSGENRRGQMLKRLSNPVDTLGNLTKSGISSGINATKSGFNATKTGISTGLNVTKTGISSGYNATKSGLSTGLSVTKTGFNKVLSTPKNLMDFSSGLVTKNPASGVAPGAPGGKSASKSDMNLQEHCSGMPTSGSMESTTGNSPTPQPPERSKSREEQSTPSLGYTNMVDKKIDALENFDKLIPRPARVNKDSPLYLCIRMGKYRKDTKRNQRFSPTYSFGKCRYEREYWFSVPKDKAKNLYHFFKIWAPDIYGDVDDVNGCEERGLEPINTDDEYDPLDDEIEGEQPSSSSAATAKQQQQQQPPPPPSSTTSTTNRLRFMRVLSTANSGDEGSPETGEMNSTANVNRQKFWRRSPLHFLKLVEDHFSTDGISGDWNVSNSSEDHSFAERYNLELNTDPIMPELIGPTELLTPEIILNLSKHLPARAEGYAWTLIYSTSVHGFSLNTLYREMRHFDSPVLMIIEDTNGAKFGALLSHSLKLSDHFYGTGETFLFTFHPTFECYPWTGENIFFIKCDINSISIGAGEGTFGLWLDGDLYHGGSHPCKTFGNQTLSSDPDFVVKSIECWGFVQ